MSDTKVNFGGVTPNLVYKDANAALEWLTSVLGFKERARYVDADDVVHQAELYVGDTEVWLSSHKDGYEGPNQYLVVWVDDVDAQHRRVTNNGIEAPEPTDQSWGVRNFYVVDPGGYYWGFHKRLVSGYEQTKSLADGGLKEVMQVQE